MTVYHTASHFHKDGILGEEHWQVLRRDILEFSDYPGLKPMMPYFQTYYAPDLEFADELAAIDSERFETGDGQGCLETLKNTR